MIAIYPDRNYLPLDDAINVGEEAEALQLDRGWSHPEGDFRWTDGSWAELTFSIASMPFALELDVRCSPFVKDEIVGQRVLAFVDGRLAHIDMLRHETTMRIPVKEALPSDGRIKLVLFLPDARRPGAEDGLADQRELGLQVASVTLRRASSPD